MKYEVSLHPVYICLEHSVEFEVIVGVDVDGVESTNVFVNMLKSDPSMRNL